MQHDASLQIWFDRDLDFGHGSLIDASIENLPRLITSRSVDKKNGNIRLARKQTVKLSVVERAMYNIGRDAAPAYGWHRGGVNHGGTGRGNSARLGRAALDHARQ